MKKIIFGLLFLFSSFQALSVKGLYVDGFASILGNTNKEDSLLNYALQNDFTYLALYELHIVHASNDLTTVPTSQILANFISKAKNTYGILEIGACGENFWWFDNIISNYNSIHSNPDEKIDVYNLEFEFWNTTSVSPGQYYCTTYLTPGGFSCDTSGAFDFFMQELTLLNALAITDGVISEIYVGWFTLEQAVEIITEADRILLHSYVNNINNVYSYAQTRLSYLGSGSDVVNVMPIFSSESIFSGPWLSSNPEIGAYEIYTNSFAAETGLWKNNINLMGYQWFDYSNMPYDLTAEIFDFNEVEFCIYPNPFLNSILINNENESMIIWNVYTISGQLISASHSSNNLVEIDLSKFNSGIYYLIIETNGRVISKKIVKE